MRGESNPQIWYASSAPHVDSVVLHSIRKRAQSEAPGRLFFAEWSAPDDASADDVDAWYQANPALGIRISEDFVRDERAALMHSPQEFLRERLGIVETQAGGGAIPLDQWQRLTDADSNIVGPLSIALDVSPDREWASFAAAGKRADDVDHVEIIDRRPGTGWIIERAAELASKWSTSITLDPSSPAGGLLGDLQSAGVSVAEVSQRSHAQACGALVDAVRNESLRHLGQPSLLAALTGAQKRTTGDVWMWSRTGSHVDITPLVAATLALWASRTAAPPKLTHSASAFVSLDDY
jgi:phage terminase large subunit-like protein